MKKVTRVWDVSFPLFERRTWNRRAGRRYSSCAISFYDMIRSSKHVKMVIVVRLDRMYTDDLFLLEGAVKR